MTENRETLKLKMLQQNEFLENKAILNNNFFI